jgi:hypothetical protein
MPAAILSSAELAAPLSRVQCKFRIGNISVKLSGDHQEVIFLNSGLEPFREGNGIDADIEVNIKWTEQICAWPGESVFDSGAVWQLFRANGDLIFDFSSEVMSIHPYKRLRVEPSLRVASVTLSREALEKHKPVYSLEYPADELLVTNHLAHHGLGVEVHGCGLIDADTGGHLFLGHSGAGKSTTARLWESLRAPEILSDDRIILRLHEDELWMYGTPWHGEGAFASPGKAKVNRIHILRHGSENSFCPVPQARGVSEVFARCFPPFHSPAGLDSTIQFIKRALDTVPCYEFNFRADGSSVAAVLGFHDS